MKAFVSTNHGAFNGKTVESIVRRVYGKRASIHFSQDPNSPEVGSVVTPLRGDPGWERVEAVVMQAEGDHEEYQY